MSRKFEYDRILGRHRGMKIAGPRVLSGPKQTQLLVVHEAMEKIDQMARDNGLRLEAIVLRKQEGA